MEPPLTLNGSAARPCAASSSGFPFAHMHVHDDDEDDERVCDTGGSYRGGAYVADSSYCGLSRMVSRHKLMSPQLRFGRTPDAGNNSYGWHLDLL